MRKFQGTLELYREPSILVLMKTNGNPTKQSTKTEAIGEMMHDIGRAIMDPTVNAVSNDTESMSRIEDSVMSNFDREVDEGVAAFLKANPRTHAGYPGWNFNGRVWFEGCWKCEVWQYRSPIEVIEAESPQELMTAVSEKYGYD